jgi:hypothetical protein
MVLFKELSLDLDESFLQSNDNSESLIPDIMIATGLKMNFLI